MQEQFSVTPSMEIRWNCSRQFSAYTPSMEIKICFKSGYDFLKLLQTANCQLIFSLTKFTRIISNTRITGNIHQFWMIDFSDF